MTWVALIGASRDLIGSPPPVGAVLMTALSVATADLPDGVYGGAYKVTGTTKVKATPHAPVSRRVRLHDQLTGLVVREQWSQAVTGEYRFERIRSGVFYVVALDHTGAYNGVIATGVAAEPM
jgi:hypothetical protein